MAANENCGCAWLSDAKRSSAQNPAAATMVFFRNGSFFIVIVPCLIGDLGHQEMFHTSPTNENPSQGNSQSRSFDVPNHVHWRKNIPPAVDQVTVVRVHHFFPWHCLHVAVKERDIARAPVTARKPAGKCLRLPIVTGLVLIKLMLG